MQAKATHESRFRMMFEKSIGIVRYCGVKMVGNAFTPQHYHTS